jgi:hypothetical protein
MGMKRRSNCCSTSVSFTHPLKITTMNGHKKVVKLLLATGRVDPEPKDSYGRTPLWWAAANGHEGVGKLLLGTGRVEPEPKDGHGRVPSWLTLSRRIQFAEDYGKMALESASESRATAWPRLAPSRVSEVHLQYWGGVYMPVENPVDSNLVWRTSSPETWIRSTVNLEHDAVIKLLLALALALALAPPLLALALALAPPLAHHYPLYTEAR